MAPEETQLVAQSSVEADPEGDELTFGKKRRHDTRLVILAVAGIALLVLACIFVATLIAIYIVPGDPTPTKLPGTWKTHFEFPGAPPMSLYIFKDNGGFQEQDFDAKGEPLGITDGRWEYRDGEVRINWQERTFEHAVLTWVDDDTVEYHVVKHTDRQQVGLKPILRRQ